MIHFAEFEARGPALAAMTEARDGDFSLEGIQAGADALETLSGTRLRSIQVVAQVHGAAVARADRDAQGVALLGEGDAIVSDVPGIALGIRIADCVPIYLYDAGRRCGGLVHAGREGTRLGIAREAVRSIREAYGAAPEQMTALIGPSAGPCCYEVDVETAQRCANEGLRVSGRMIDLWSSNRDQLVAAGLLAGNVDTAGVCTICNPAFHSYRRTKSKLRNLALLML